MEWGVSSAGAHGRSRRFQTCFWSCSGRTRFSFLCGVHKPRLHSPLLSNIIIGVAHLHSAPLGMPQLLFVTSSSAQDGPYPHLNQMGPCLCVCSWVRPPPSPVTPPTIQRSALIDRSHNTAVQTPSSSPPPSSDLPRPAFSEKIIFP